jgi:hypothetical protein
MLNRLALFLDLFPFVLNKLENQPGVGEVTITNELHSTCKSKAKSVSPCITLSTCESICARLILRIHTQDITKSNKSVINSWTG